VAEGVVLLKNDNNVLPLTKQSRIAVFGRIQTHYYKSGTGSGGMVNVSKVIGILDALLESPDISVNRRLLNVYREWESTHPFNLGIGWGNEPWSQEEMPLSEELVRGIAEETDTAIVIIGRTAGEEQDNHNVPGAYQLSDIESGMLSQVRKAYEKMVVVLNVGGIIDMNFVEKIKPDAVLYGWQGGMIGGLGTVDVLTGKVSPSGKLTDTIAHSISDYPADPFFGDKVRNFYAEDIYVGYRYFETAAADKVQYPFGFGLSYTTFHIRTEYFDDTSGTRVQIRVSVRNSGTVSGKEVVQIYTEVPQGLLGKPARDLVAFQKTRELMPDEVQYLEFSIEKEDLASYDDSGITGHKACYVLEAGVYTIFAGSSVRDVQKAGEFELAQLVVTQTLEEALAPDLGFKRMKPHFDETGAFAMKWEYVPLGTVDESKRRERNLPAEIPYTGDIGYKLSDVWRSKVSIEDFVGQLSDEDLSCIIRGEGMGSPKVTPGTAAAFGGVSKQLDYLGIPCGCCDDGPSGMRLDCGAKAFSLPNGTLMGCTYNTELMERLFEMTGWEMVKNKVDTLLGPGMNIHRHPLNGRNFEYFSEDPLLTGKMAAAQLRGIRKAGVTGTIKHFCGNNQETGRHEIDSVISERALREIYLKGFEIAVKEGNATSVMTTYGAVNGVWTAGRYDLNTQILRQEWGFRGIVMTDWWANINEKGMAPDKTNFAAMVRSQNDLYMVCPDGAVNSEGDNTLEALKEGKIMRSELQRSAKNICEYLLESHALARKLGHDTKVTVIHYEEADPDFDQRDVVYYPVDDGAEISLENVAATKGTSYIFALDVIRQGGYDVEMTGKSDLGELAQIPITIFVQSTPVGVFTWNGTGGKWVTQRKRILLHSRYSAVRMYFGESGVQLQKLKFTLLQEIKDIDNIDEYMKG
jgi:beta-glucosidase